MLKRCLRSKFLKVENSRPQSRKHQIGNCNRKLVKTGDVFKAQFDHESSIGVD